MVTSGWAVPAGVKRETESPRGEGRGRPAEVARIEEMPGVKISSLGFVISDRIEHFWVSLLLSFILIYFPEQKKTKEEDTNHQRSRAWRVSPEECAQLPNQGGSRCCRDLQWKDLWFCSTSLIELQQILYRWIHTGERSVLGRRAWERRWYGAAFSSNNEAIYKICQAKEP